jgi:FkbH-like protein
MKLAHALEIVRRRGTATGDPSSVWLACGCEPLHLRTFLAAELMERLAPARVEVHTGLFDDLVGTITRAADAGDDPVAIVVEWSDLDPRLGLRRLGGWRADQLDDIVAKTRTALERLERAVLAAAHGRRIVCVMPTLPLPPLFPPPPGQSGPHELALRALAAGVAARLSTEPGVSIVSHQTLDNLSPPAGRRDVKAELVAGFPYSLEHASAVAALLAELLCPPAPRRGLITDLDDTLWAGLLDEAGPGAVSWSGPDHRHALYQQLLASLAGAGVLIGVASRNDPGLVAEALARPDLLVGRDALYPVEVTWGAKSRSISRILDTWNIAADSVVFIDDSPMELAEVKAAWPQMECLQFPGKDPANTEAFLRKLRDLFGKAHVGAEDTLRLESLRRSAEFRTEAEHSGGAPEAFLAQAGATITAEFNPPASDGRVLELVNKTNQFNLNGHRYTEAEWRKQLEQPGAFVLAVSYEDKFGPLGKIAVLCGRHVDRSVDLSAWVMSCRAFSRRVEDRCLEILFDRFGVETIRFRFEPTAKNGPTGEAFERYLQAKPTEQFELSRARFSECAPLLYHRVQYIEH